MNYIKCRINNAINFSESIKMQGGAGIPRRGLSGLMSNTVGIMSMGLFSITLFYFGYRKGLEPILKQRKMKQSEEFADFVYQEEMRVRAENEQRFHQ